MSNEANFYTASSWTIGGLHEGEFLYRPLLEYRRFPNKNQIKHPTLNLSKIHNNNFQLSVFLYRPLLEYRRCPTRPLSMEPCLSIQPTLPTTAVSNQAYLNTARTEVSAESNKETLYTALSWTIGGLQPSVFLYRPLLEYRRFKKRDEYVSKPTAQNAVSNDASI